MSAKIKRHKLAQFFHKPYAKLPKISSTISINFSVSKSNWPILDFIILEKFTESEILI
jgi:hypothetical protein